MNSKPCALNNAMDENNVGRPTEYNDQILVRARAYLDLCQDSDRKIDEELEPQPHGGSLKRSRENILDVKIPTKGGLARYLGVHRDTLYAWSKVYPEFSDIMEAVGAEQEDRLINKGLSGAYNPTIAKVLLTKHGYREGIDQTTNDKDLPKSELSVDIQAMAKEVAEKLKEQKLNDGE